MVAHLQFRRRFVLIPAFSLGLITSCGITDSTPKVPIEQAIGVEVVAPRLTLTNPGTAPLQVLKFADIEQSRQKLEVRIGESFTQEITDVATSQQPPVINPEAMEVFRTTLTAMTKPAADPTVSSRSVFLELDTPSHSKPSVNHELASARGFAFGWFANESGKISSVNFSAPQQATDDARTTVEQHMLTLTSVPVIFPDAPIGVGASWTVESRVQTVAQTFLQTLTYSVESIADTTVTLNVDLSQRPTLGALRTEEGTDLEVLDTSSTTTGTLEIDLRHPLPTAGELYSVSRVAYGTKDSETRVVQDVGTSLVFQSQ